MINTDIKGVSIFIRGVSNGACAAHVEWVLERVPGIRGVNVNTMNGDVNVEYDSSQASFGKIISALEGSSYRVSGFTCREREMSQVYLPLKIGKVKVS